MDVLAGYRSSWTSDGYQKLEVLCQATGEVPKWVSWGFRKAQLSASERQNKDVLAGYRASWMIDGYQKLEVLCQATGEVPKWS